MTDVVRVSSKEVRPRVQAGETLLVCAYDSDEKFQKFHLDGAISLSEFNTKKEGLNKDKELVFYCA